MFSKIQMFFQVNNQQDCLPHPACGDAGWQLQAERKDLLVNLGH